MQFTVRADDEVPQLFQGTYTFHPAGVLEICADDGRCLFVSPRWWLEIKEMPGEPDTAPEDEVPGGIADLIRAATRRLRSSGASPAPASPFVRP